jgi:hypothetical protein
MEWFVVHLNLGEAGFVVQADGIDKAKETAVEIAAKIISDSACSLQIPWVVDANQLEDGCIPGNAYTKDVISRMFPGHSREQEG